MKTIRLGDVADVRISGVDKKTLPNEIPVRLCNYTDVYYNWAIRTEKRQGFMLASAKQDEITKFRLHAGQVAITKDSETRGDIGHATFIVNDFDDVILGYHCALITPHTGKLDGQYLNALFRMHYVSDYLARNAGGSGQRYYLSESAIRSIPLFLPPIATQLRIAGVLGSIDEKIELNRKKIAELEALAKTIYDYWFVQFDFPDKNGKPYKSSGGKMVWNEQLKREVPEGWEAGNLYDIASFENGLACQRFRPKGVEASLPVIKIREMHDGINPDTERVSANIPAKHKIADGDLLFSWSASLEAMIWCGGDGGLNQHIFKVLPHGEYSVEYVYRQLASYIVTFAKMAEARKTTMGHITAAHIKQSRVILPSAETLSRFAAGIKPIFEGRIILRKEIRSLVAQRDTLLPLLMNGQVSAE